MVKGEFEVIGKVQELFKLKEDEMLFLGNPAILRFPQEQKLIVVMSPSLLQRMIEGIINK